MPPSPVIMVKEPPIIKTKKTMLAALIIPWGIALNIPKKLTGVCSTL
jgi:hypothetical protein